MASSLLAALSFAGASGWCRKFALSLSLLLSLAAISSAQEKAAASFRPPASALEVLKTFNIGESQFSSFFSGQPLSPAEEEVLAKILYRWPRLGQEYVESWRQKGVTWDQVVADSETHRGEIFHFRGRVTRVAKVVFSPEVAERLEYDHYFAATIKIQDSPSVALVYARYLPAAWKVDAEIDEPISVDGLFLKVGDTTAEPPPLIFAAERIAWHPDKPHPEDLIGADQVALAQAGVDWGLYEVVKKENGRGIGGPDREPFYQTLAVFAGERGAKIPAATSVVDIPLLLQKSETVLGNRMKIRGLARRITKVTVSAEDIRKRFGITHYYEIDISVPLDKPMKVAKSAKDKDSLLYANEFPVVLLVPRLPPDLQVGENRHDQIAADGTFYKLWTYQSSYASEKNMRQAAPLLMSSEVRLIPPANPFSGYAGAIGTTAVVVAGGIILIIYMWFRMTDRKTATMKPAASIHEALRKGAEQAHDEKPNFEGLK
ncbi:MAG: hypothetical protein K8R36_18120 [Planctomycetales bacterium]|nr:hypothetical protein [Planctomycetales bacterium]